MWLPSLTTHAHDSIYQDVTLLVAKPNISVWTECGLRPPLCLALGTLADGLLSGSLSAALGSAARSACLGLREPDVFLGKNRFPVLHLKIRLSEDRPWIANLICNRICESHSTYDSLRQKN